MRFRWRHLIGLLAVVAAVAIFAAAVAVQLWLTPDHGRPTPAVLAPYELSYVGPSGTGEMTVDQDGAVCTRFRSSDFLLTACTLALNLDPQFIAGEAFGELNTRDTPAY